MKNGDKSSTKVADRDMMKSKYKAGGCKSIKEYGMKIFKNLDS